MPSVHLKNVPEELYRSLRARARSNRRSIAAEILSLLGQAVPTAAEVRRRAALYRRIQRLRPRKGFNATGRSAEDLLRKDREH